MASTTERSRPASFEQRPSWPVPSSHLSTGVMPSDLLLVALTATSGSRLLRSPLQVTKETRGYYLLLSFQAHLPFRTALPSRVGRLLSSWVSWVWGKGHHKLWDEPGWVSASHRTRSSPGMPDSHLGPVHTWKTLALFWVLIPLILKAFSASPSHPRPPV